VKHHQAKRTLGRTRSQHSALIRSLARSLIIREKIQTTEAKAKELRPFIERLVTHSRTGTLSARRLVASRLGNDTAVVQKLFKTIGPKYKERSGGYTRITKLSTQKADARKMAQIEFV